MTLVPPVLISAPHALRPVRTSLESSYYLDNPIPFLV